MNDELLNQDISDYLSHAGVPGMSWYKHKFGKWQKQAQYAGGMDDPKEHKRRIGAIGSDAKDSNKKLNLPKTSGERGREGIKRTKDDLEKSKRMSIEELRKETERMQAENSYQDQIKYRMQNEINLRKLENQYYDTFKDPIKRNFFVKMFTDMRDDAIKAGREIAIQTGKNYAKAKAYNFIKEKFGPEMANSIYNIKPDNNKKTYQQGDQNGGGQQTNQQGNQNGGGQQTSEDYSSGEQRQQWFDKNKNKNKSKRKR